MSIATHTSQIARHMARRISMSEKLTNRSSQCQRENKPKLQSILDYIHRENTTESSKFLTDGSSPKETPCLGSLARWGSALVRIDWSKYREFLEKDNRKEYSSARFNYAVRFYDCYLNPSKILTVSTSIRANVLKALIALSKFQGEYLEFKQQLKEHGIK